MLPPRLLLEHTIFTISGHERTTISGTYAADELADRLIDEWIPYFECHHCGRFDYCKFVRRNANFPSRAQDIKCGVAATAIRSLTERCFPLLLAADGPVVQSFLDGAFHFHCFVYRAEVQIGNFLDKDILDWWDEFAPAAFGQLTALRAHLDEVARHFGQLSPVRAQNAVLLVEGWSEKAMIERLKQSGLACFTSIAVRTYDGKQNSRPGKLQMLLNDYQERGYNVFIQGDADGRDASGVFDDLCRKQGIPRNRTFVFEHDLETSIPPPLLYVALKELGELDGIEREVFLAAIGSDQGAVGPRLEARFGVLIAALKVPLAQTVADLFNRAHELWNHPGFMSTEFGRFLTFLGEVQ